LNSGDAGVAHAYAAARINRENAMNLQPDLDFCPECEAKLEYDAGELTCPNCGWVADEVRVRQYEQGHDYAPGRKNE